MLPANKKLLPVAQEVAKSAPAAGATIQYFALPKVSAGAPSALEAINAKISSAQREVIVAARQIAATSILTNLKARETAGVEVITLLSPDVTVDFASSRLAVWMRKNQLTGVYQDIMSSASQMMVIDGRTVIISDLPFSQRAYEAPDEATARAAQLGFVYIIEDSTLATGLESELKARALAKNKML
jgi:phosphatidylserine/phosphatidylglycerophosphate/cardiolipin synthase-like enzyme